MIYFNILLMFFSITLGAKSFSDETSAKKVLIELNFGQNISEMENHIYATFKG